MFLRYQTKFNRNVKHCSGRPGFVYCFQNEDLETYENYLKHKRDFPFTVTCDLETTTGFPFRNLREDPCLLHPIVYCLIFIQSNK